MNVDIPHPLIANFLLGGEGSINRISPVISEFVKMCDSVREVVTQQPQILRQDTARAKSRTSRESQQTKIGGQSRRSGESCPHGTSLIQEDPGRFIMF